MRLFVALGAAATFVPGSALACSLALGVFDPVPSAGQAMPVNGQLVALVSPGPEALSRVTFLSDSGVTTALEWRPFGPHHVIIEFDGAVEAGVVQTELLNEGAIQSFEIGPLARADGVPPSDASSFSMTAEFEPFDQCFGPGLRVSGSFLPSTDDVGVAGYAFVQIQPNDAVRVIGVVAEPEVSTGLMREFYLFVQEQSPPQPGDEFCLTLRAFDRAGNWQSGFGETVCHAWPSDPPPPPPPDAGFIDSGVRDGGNPAEPPDRDGGVAVPDAGSTPSGGGGLDETDSGCGCSAAETGGGGAWLLLGLVVFLRRRR